MACSHVDREELPNLVGGGELAVSCVAQLPVFDRALYLLGHSFPPPALHHTPNRCPLRVPPPLLAQIQPPSLSLSFFLLIPKSDSDRWPGCLTRQSLPLLLLLLSPLAVFSCVPSNGQCAKGLPVNFLLPGLIQYYLAARDDMNFSRV